MTEGLEQGPVWSKTRPIAAVAAVRLAGGALFAVALGGGLVAYLTTFAIVPGPWPGPHGVTAVVVDAGLFTGFALHHSIFARTRLKQWTARLVSPDLERSFYVIVASLLFIMILRLWEPVPGVVWQVTGATAIVLAGLQVAGLLFTGYAAHRLGALELAGVKTVPQVFRGVEAVEAQVVATPTPILKESGVYGLVRHPIYLAWLLMVWPAPVMTGSRLCFAAISTIYLVVAIPLEERTLVRDFGQAYVNYQKKVRWRMVPGLY